MAQLSTAFSELLLFVFSCFMVHKVYSLNKLISFALAATCAASLIGILKYGLSTSRSDVYRWHRFFTKIAFAFTPAFFASVYVAQVHSMGSLAFFVAPIIITFFISEIAPETQETFMTLMGGAAVVSIAYVSFIQHIFFGMLGISLMVISSLLAQTEGSVLGLKRIDMFHLTLIPSLYFLTNGVLTV